jgi:hypothetical protein
MGKPEDFLPRLLVKFQKTRVLYQPDIGNEEKEVEHLVR